MPTGRTTDQKTMQVTEAVNQGLKRELKIVVTAEDMGERLNKRLDELKGQMRLNGFRPGKVPKSHIKKVYGKSVMAEIVNDIISNSTKDVLQEREETPAMQPEVSMTEDKAEAEKVLVGIADFEFSLTYEVMPEISLPDLDKLKIERPVVEVEDAEVEEQVATIAESARTYTAKKGKAKDGDQLTIAYAGKVDGEVFEGGADDDTRLVLGSNTFIPGFEGQLVGKKADDKTVVKVTFPKDYGAEHLAGKEAEFDVTVKEVGSPDAIKIDDDLAKKLGLESAEKLREAVLGQIESRYGSFTRAKIKRQILDQLDEQTNMELPEKMVEQEFDNIWNQMTQELERTEKTFADEDTTEEAAREEYKSLAERRVRLGLTMAKIGESASVTVTEEEMQRALYDQMRQHPGQEQMVMDYFRNNPDAMAGIRAPLYEEKVVDHIVEMAEVTDKTVTAEELMKEDEG